MSEGEQPNQPQRYCTNCGAEVRQGNAFCVSCGASLTGEPAEPAMSHPQERSSGYDQPPADPVMDFLRNLERRFKGAFANLRMTDLGDAPRRMLGWFGNLHPAIRLLLAGLVLLVLVVLLSPVMRVIAIIAFLVSVAFLILNGVQRRFSPIWSVAAASSLVLVFVFGGLSGAIYGNGSMGSSDSEPGYEIVTEGGTNIEGGGSFGVLMVASDSLSSDQLETIAEDLTLQTEEYDAANVTVYDRQEAVYEDGVRSQETGELYSGDLYLISIAHTAVGENVAEMPATVGNYVVDRQPGPGNSDAPTYSSSPSASPDASASPEAASDETPTDEENAEILLITMQAGMVDGDRTIRDVQVSGTEATVIVSGVSDEYAESACSFVLGAAPELMMESESNDYAGITEVSVKRPLRPWNTASC